MANEQDTKISEANRLQEEVKTGSVGTMRQQSAYLPWNSPIIIKIGDELYRVTRSYPDSTAGGMSALYLEVTQTHESRTPNKSN